MHKIIMLSCFMLLCSGSSISEANPSPDWRQDLLKAAAKKNIYRLESIDDGILGKYKNSVVFFSKTLKIPNVSRLYWVMVKVLSEKYGCFMTQKVSNQKMISFRCRDGRRVVFRHGVYRDTIHFFANQYDSRGNPIIIPRASRITHH